MPTFVYEALNESGKTQKGQVTASSSEDAIARVRSQGFFPTSVREQKVKKGKKGKAPTGDSTSNTGETKKSLNLSITIGGVSNKLVTAFTRQLSTLQDAGLPILRSLSILEQQQRPGLFKQIIQGVHGDVSNGTTLSDAMSTRPKAFDKLYCKMITAGEVGGVLDVILSRLAEFMEKAQKLKAKIIGAMIYPAVVITVACVIVLGIMLFIVPSFEKIFDDFDSKMPALTVFLISSSKWLGGRLYPDQVLPGAVYVIVSPIFFILFLKMARKTTIGLAIIDNITLKLPVLGQLVAKTTIARFTRTLGTLINAGVPILDAITITRETTGNYVYNKALGAVHDSVRQGESFAEPLGKANICDPIMVNMIDVGEETGDLDKMMTRIADNYEEDVDILVTGLVSMLEPLMVVFLGLIVGFIVISLFLPMVALIQTMM